MEQGCRVVPFLFMFAFTDITVLIGAGLRDMPLIAFRLDTSGDGPFQELMALSPKT